MSSIYKKGRDGYYYYQAYIFNNKTGKKDKRIFHSLGTKDHEVAIKKQKEYDKEYENKSKRPESTNNFSVQKILSFIIITIIIFTIFNIFNDNRSNTESIVAQINNRELETINKRLDTDSIKEEVNTVLDKDDLAADEIKTLKDYAIEKVDANYKLPTYNIEKIEKLKGAFDQAKINITIDNKYDSNELKILCENIKDKYSQFSNIVICIYDNSIIGKKLAKSEGNDINYSQKQKAWLVMYTYNSVEGSYFDDEPGGYIGVY